MAPDSPSDKGSIRVPIALIAALALGGGGATAATRLLDAPAPPAPVIDVAPIYRKIDGVEERLRTRETAAARTDEKLDGILRAIDRLDKKLDEAPPRRR